MRWRVLGPLLGVILVGAVLFSMWPSAPPPGNAELDLRAAVPPPAPPPSLVERALPTSQPTTAKPPEAPPAPAPGGLGELDPEVDPDHLRALGLGPEDLEPLDGGALLAATLVGLKAAVNEALPQLRHCNRGWLQPNAARGARIKIEFTIAEIPGRNRAKVMQVQIADAGVVVEHCVRDAFKATRFETPRGGETRVSYPLQFKPGPP
jgi:hypothetical protein